MVHPSLVQHFLNHQASPPELAARHHLTGEESPKSIYISNPKTGIKQIEQFNMSLGLHKKAQDAQDAVLRFLKFSVSVWLTRRLRFLKF